MKNAIIFSILALLVTSSAFARGAQDDDSISNFERGIICQAIEANNPKKLTSSEDMPGWMHCREYATFTRIDDDYGVMIETAKGPLVCRAKLGEGTAKTPPVTVKCRSMLRK